jgi:hypothetical protein
VREGTIGPGIALDWPGTAGGFGAAHDYPIIFPVATAGSAGRSYGDCNLVFPWRDSRAPERGCEAVGVACGRRDQHGNAAQGQHLVPSEPPHPSHRTHVVTRALAIGVGPEVDTEVHKASGRPFRPQFAGTERSVQVAGCVQTDPGSRHQRLLRALMRLALRVIRRRWDRRLAMSVAPPSPFSPVADWHGLLPAVLAAAAVAGLIRREGHIHWSSPACFSYAPPGWWLGQRLLLRVVFLELRKNATLRHTRQVRFPVLGLKCVFSLLNS